jgi:hypothetical protein
MTTVETSDRCNSHLLSRVADYSIIVAKNTLTLNYPTKIVLETVDILKRFGDQELFCSLLVMDFTLAFAGMVWRDSRDFCYGKISWTAWKP